MKHLGKIIIIFLGLALFFVLSQVVRSPSSDSVLVYFLDVGQGDAALIKKGDQEILIDGGPDNRVVYELGKILKPSDRQIEIIILTHPHADHLVGINRVLDHFEVGKIYSTGVSYDSNQYLEFLQTVKNKNIELIVPAKGQEEIFFPNSQTTFLWPGADFKDLVSDNLNNSSEILKFCYFKQCLFLPGDAEKEEQDQMFQFYGREKPDFDFHSIILKVSHHGSENAANDILYEKVLPRYSLFSVGADNKYGHPHLRSLDLAAKFKSEVFRTDREGTIEFILTKEGAALQK
jgi:competence protein ComEC